MTQNYVRITQETPQKQQLPEDSQCRCQANLPCHPGTLQVNAAPAWWLSKQHPTPSSGASTAEGEIIFVSSQGRATGEKRSAVLEGLVYISKENASASESCRVLAVDGAERL